MYEYRRVKWGRAVAVAVAVMVAAGCSSKPPIIQDTAGPTAPSSVVSSPPAPVTSSSSVTSSSAVSTPSPDPTTATPSTTASTGATMSTPTSPSSVTPSIGAKEAADRKAAEQAWLDYDRVAGDLWKKPAKTWRPTLSRYAVEPILTEAVKSLKAGAKAGKGNWGRSEHHLYWQVPINGEITANLGDCIDDSHTGSMDVQTGKKLTVGVPHDNTLISLVREKDGWKVADVTYLVNQPCPGQKLSASQEGSSIAAARSSAKASS